MEDIQIRALCYGRRSGRLEIEFTWTDDVRQFHPVSPQLYRQLINAPKPMYLALDRLIFKPRWMRQRLRANGNKARDHDGANVPLQTRT